ncbi:MAG: N-acetylglucosamine-6-phosphate deacetylase [Candidatus Marinimicrobia bacterium]|nr:N-acetylglucosamine-6-phosphate deacetylase [Candidatus Neomarinimicrobiota bacterium]MDD5582104.1 N-acetylglucosamine-6-phosphate deacetylase [Candidatus Neomarinimicrobiota bacterium]
MLIRNVHLLSNKDLVDVFVDSGKILRIEQADPFKKGGVDGKGLFLVSGFTDLHVHGAGGTDFSCGDSEKIIQADRMLTRLGTTSYLATTFYLPHQPNTHLEVLRQLYASGQCLGMKGIHLEGPFISPQKRGGILPDRISPYKKEILEDIFHVCGNALRMMTLAPEQEPTGVLINALKTRNVIPSFGHSDATDKQTRQSLDQGIEHVTHLCNAMRPIHHRDPGPIPEIVESNVIAQIIADGAHLVPRMVKFLASIMGVDRCVCITDGMLSTGLPDGDYLYQGKPFKAKNGEARYLHNNELIGTSLSVQQIAQRFMNFTTCSLEKAVKTVTENPCRVLGTQPLYSTIQEGAIADLLLIDKALNLHRVWKNGEDISSD